MSYISASVMHFKGRGQGSGDRGQEKINPVSCILHRTLFILLLFTVHCSLFTVVHAEVLERIVAIVDDEVVMLSEFNETFKSTSARDYRIKVTQKEVLDSLINRILLLKEAKRFNIEHASVIQTEDDDVLINEYIERRLRAFIYIPFDEIELFFKENKESFGGKDFYDVRDEIEEYLIEKELNKKLIKHIEELRKNAYIRIQLAIEGKPMDDQ